MVIEKRIAFNTTILLIKLIIQRMVNAEIRVFRNRTFLDEIKFVHHFHLKLSMFIVYESFIQIKSKQKIIIKQMRIGRQICEKSQMFN